MDDRREKVVEKEEGDEKENEEEEKKDKMQEIRLYHHTEGHYMKDQLHKKAQVRFLSLYSC